MTLTEKLTTLTLAEYRELSDSLIPCSPDERALCLSSLYYLIRFMLNRPDMEKPWLLDRCREVESDPDDRLDLWSREHYKSTIITFGLTIQDVLRDPEDTVGIFSHTRPIAKGFLRQIMRELAGNERLKETFPDVLWANPDKDAPKWSEDDGIILKRQGNPKESTIEAWGLVDGQPTSKHFKRMVYDDVVVKGSVTSPEMMAKTLEAVEQSYNLGSDGGKRRFIGTRYHQNDVYKTIKDRGTATERIRLATHDGTLDGDLAIWSRETLLKKRRDMGPYTFSAQIMQNPTFDQTQGFKREWLRHYSNRSGEGMNKYMLVDAANSKRKASDYTSIWIIGLSADRNYYALDMVRDRLNLTERTQSVMRLHRKWRPREVRYEAYGLMADVGHIRSVQESENYRFDILEVKGGLPKNDRIRRVIPICEQGRFYLPHSLHYTDHEGKVVDLVHEFIETEYVSFPVSAHDDMLDSLARIEEPDLPLVWPKGTVEPMKDRYGSKRAKGTAWAA